MEVQPPTPSFQIPAYVLDDLCSRFIINIPEEERQDLIRVFFQIELAHWFYLDFYCAETPELKTCGIKDFSAQIFHHCPTLSGHAQEVDKILGNWKSYKMSVPTYGCIMLDPDMKYCLLVQGFWTKASWGFPKGKINEDESGCDCAIREVYEETGFDVKHLIDKDHYLENKMNDQVTRLYIVLNVPLDTKFQPKTRKEIKSLQWFPIEALPQHKRDQTTKSQLGMNPNTFFMVIPFVKPLRKWITNRQNQSQNASGGRQSAGNDVYGNKPNKHEDSNKYHEWQKQKQKTFFAQQNMNEFQEFMSLKDTSSRSRDTRDTKTRSDSPRKDAYQKGRYNSNQGNIGFSPNSKQDKKPQYQIMTRDGTVVGKPRRSLATQFDVQGTSSQQQDMKQERRSSKRKTSTEYIPEAWKNFRFDVASIMACLPT